MAHVLRGDKDAVKVFLDTRAGVIESGGKDPALVRRELERARSFLRL